MGGSGLAWPRLVFVEGLPGSGKSTTAQWIAHEIETGGRPSRWIYEEEMPHPVLGAAPGPYSSWKDLLTHRLSAWATFAAAVRASEAVTVVDSTFLQSSVASMLRRNLEPDTILTYIDRVTDLVQPLDPALVYFLEADSDAAFRRICERRGMAWTLFHLSASDGMAWTRMRGLSGFDGLLAYWREHARVCDAAVSRSRLRTVIVESGIGDWPARRHHIAEFLGPPWPPRAAHSEPDLARFVGRYRGETGRQACVSVRDDALVVEGLLWRDNRLLPRGVAAFDAESWPFRLIFEADTTGVVSRFRLDGPDLVGRRLSGVYDKIAS
jgi:thymidylate kinase